jgi:MFS transporter, CP family, cyanate transporter
MRQVWVTASLLWLAGMALRITILAVPPVITLIQSDLGMSGTQVGILSALPTLLFGVAALIG